MPRIKKKQEKAPGVCLPFGFPRLREKNGRDFAASPRFSACLGSQPIGEYFWNNPISA